MWLWDKLFHSFKQRGNILIFYNCLELYIKLASGPLITDKGRTTIRVSWRKKCHLYLERHFCRLQIHVKLSFQTPFPPPFVLFKEEEYFSLSLTKCDLECKRIKSQKACFKQAVCIEWPWSNIAESQTHFLWRKWVICFTRHASVVPLCVLQNACCHTACPVVLFLCAGLLRADGLCLKSGKATCLEMHIQIEMFLWMMFRFPGQPPKASKI